MPPLGTNIYIILTIWGTLGDTGVYRCVLIEEPLKNSKKSVFVRGSFTWKHKGSNSRTKKVTNERWSLISVVFRQGFHCVAFCMFRLPTVQPWARVPARWGQTVHEHRWHHLAGLQPPAYFLLGRQLFLLQWLPPLHRQQAVADHPDLPQLPCQQLANQSELCVDRSNDKRNIYSAHLPHRVEAQGALQ